MRWKQLAAGCSHLLTVYYFSVLCTESNCRSHSEEFVRSHRTSHRSFEAAKDAIVLSSKEELGNDAGIEVAVPEESLHDFQDDSKVSSNVEKDFERSLRAARIPMQMPEDSHPTGRFSPIPLFMLKQINSINSSMEYLQDILRLPEAASSYKPVSVPVLRSGGLALQHSHFGEVAAGEMAMIPRPARCEPLNETIKLEVATEPDTIYWPTCTRLPRCSGCCNSELLVCEPISSYSVNLHVILSKWIPAEGFRFVGKKPITVEGHSSCSCNCQVKQKDCNVFQRYRADECRCDCSNNEAHQLCILQPKTKIWNPSDCTCKCRRELTCSTGTFFDQETCEKTNFSKVPVRQKILDHICHSEGDH